MKPFENDKNDVYLISKYFFALKILRFFSWLFVHVEKKARLERWGVTTRLTVTIHQFIYCPRSAQGKEHQIMAFAQLIEYDKINFFLYKLCRKCGERLVPDLFFLFKKAFYEGKAIGLQFVFNIFR